MVMGRAFSAGISTFELFVSVSLPLVTGAATEGFELAGVVLDDVVAEFEFDEASTGTPELD
jgi:hypothetical protein